MRDISITRGLDIPIDGAPASTISTDKTVNRIALVGDDYIDMKPTMLVAVGDRVQRGQPLFSDKKNEGVHFTAPAAGTVAAINRGAKRRFQSIAIDCDGDDHLSFCEPDTDPARLEDQELPGLLVASGLWTAFRTRPYGKIPPVDGRPASLFVTAIDTQPLAPDMSLVLAELRDDFMLGLEALSGWLHVPVYVCHDGTLTDPGTCAGDVRFVSFRGPHPAGLPSTHIHFLDPVHEHKTVWHIGLQDVAAVGELLRTGTLTYTRIVALAGPSVKEPRHLRTLLGASINDLCAGELVDGEQARRISGSVLDGRQATEVDGFLGRYHQQVSCLPEGDGRQLFGWLRPGGDRFSVTRAFWSAFSKPARFPFNTAVWGGDRAIFPLGTYEKVMPLDIIPVYLLKSLASGNSERAKELGCLELIEEDLALCCYVCPGKNDFSPMLRRTLSTIEQEG
ncbi:MAG: Na(+)-translocating NADH-quinone reductase subunit A [Desulfofustis sp.]|jgi:Na+-transporting NADH:ubiquinone oxidoreductase subunit A|nr:Na(+)-translocating NADH-quinone reductase subunit A [Desulfofustis sp.]